MAAWELAIICGSFPALGLLIARVTEDPIVRAQRRARRRAASSERQLVRRSRAW